jgi:hypothetical protein
MTELDRGTPLPAPSAAVRSCWICGIRLPAEQMVADGGSACADIRWYCRDMRGCTERWTSRPAMPADLYQGATSTQGTQLTGLAAGDYGTYGQ